jgi:hypothetical protein
LTQLDEPPAPRKVARPCSASYAGAHQLLFCRPSARPALRSPLLRRSSASQLIEPHTRTTSIWCSGTPSRRRLQPRTCRRPRAHGSWPSRSSLQRQSQSCRGLPAFEARHSRRGSLDSSLGGHTMPAQPLSTTVVYRKTERHPMCTQCGGSGYVYLWSVERLGARQWFCDRCKRSWSDAGAPRE